MRRVRKALLQLQRTEQETRQLWRGCVDKRPYPSKRHALSQLRRSADPMLMPYRCKACGKWHLGHHRRVVIMVVEEDC